MCAVALSCWKMKVELSPQVCESDRFGRYRGCNGKTSTVCHQPLRQSSSSTQGSYAASLLVPVATNHAVCTRDTLRRQHYVRTSKNIQLTAISCLNSLN